MTAPFVVAGGIVRNRAWILPDHLRAVAFNKPAQMFYLWGDCKDATGEILRYGVAHYEHGAAIFVEYRPVGDAVGQWCGVPLEELRHDTGEPGYTRDGSDGPRYRSAHMAAERNLWAQEALKRWPQATHLLVVDSDVLPEPDVLEKLLAVDAPVACAYVPVGDGFPIYMEGDRSTILPPEEIERTKFSPYRTGHERSHMTPFQCYLAGGCYLVKREVFKFGPAVESFCGPWSEHRLGEDGGFAEHCRLIGFKMIAVPAARCQHLMTRDDR